MKLVVADSGPLIALASTGHVGALLQIAHHVVIPETVFQECTADPAKPGAILIIKAVQAGQIEKQPDPSPGIFQGIPDLDLGETLAIALADQLQSVILIDDAVGRLVAKAHHLRVIGACGILLEAKRQGLIGKVGPILVAWRSNLGYFIAPGLEAEVLRLAGEPQR